MDSSAVTLKALSERVLEADGALPLELLLLHLAPVDQLRKIAKKLGLSPKGGFRIERAPAKVLAPLLAEQREAKRLEDVVSLLLPKPPEPPPEAQQQQADAEAVTEARALLGWYVLRWYKHCMKTLEVFVLSTLHHDGTANKISSMPGHGHTCFDRVMKW